MIRIGKINIQPLRQITNEDVYIIIPSMVIFGVGGYFIGVFLMGQADAYLQTQDLNTASIYYPHVYPDGVGVLKIISGLICAFIGACGISALLCWLRKI